MLYVIKTRDDVLNTTINVKCLLQNDNIIISRCPFL